MCKSKNKRHYVSKSNKWNIAIKDSEVGVISRLFGDEDTDLRQLPVTTERPPTPPPPIISSSVNISEDVEGPKSNLDVVRAKLANATINKKKMSLEDQDFRIPKLSITADIPNKIIISPEDENCIKSGTLTKEQEAHLLNKIILQMEKNKLQVAKKKDHEESFNISLQPISDDELVGSDEDKDKNDNLNDKIASDSVSESNTTPFNDKDERLRPTHIQQKSDQIHLQYHPKDTRDLRKTGVPYSWRGGVRGGRRHWENQLPAHPRAPGRPWNPSNSWRNMSPNFPSRDFGPGPRSLQEEEASESPDLPTDQLTNGAVNQDETKSIVIDGLPKDIRFYDETAVVFINWDDPREISFQDGVRHVVFNDTDSFLLGFNKPYQEVLINSSPHVVRLGAPSREIFIDQVPYECYFGSAGIRIDLNGVSTTVKLEGPPPQVKISETRRTDLVAGKINLFINAKIVVPVFLDAKPQKFMIDGETILPKGVKPGHVIIKDMEGQGNISPRFEDTSQDNISEVDTNEPAVPVISTSKQPKIGDSPERNSNSPSFFQSLIQQQNLNNLDVLSNVMTPSIGPVSTTGGYQVQNVPENEAKQSLSSSQFSISSVPQTLNINDLFQKLVASGFVTSGNDQKTSSVHGHVKLDTETKLKNVNLDTFADSSQPLPLKPIKRNPFDNLKPITFAKPETLKIRQGGLYTHLYAGMQCSSCGMRFSPEASMQYSQHLDWHFRQNRKGKRNIRIATSRKWYYSLSDWKNYEELEDLEERGEIFWLNFTNRSTYFKKKNYFDQQQQAENVGEEAEEEIEIPSVPADPETTDECCDVCRDKFDQFFNEEKEEWHLRNAIRIDDKTYHPVCYEDYLQSLEESLNESKTETSVAEEKPEESTIPGLEIIIDDDEDESQKNNSPDTAEIVSLESDESKTQTEVAKGENQDGDDDDVILNEVAPIKIVVDDDDDENQENNPEISDSVKIKEEKLDDGFLEVAGLVSLQNGGQIKIKAEPVDPDELTLAPQTESEQQSSGSIEVQSKNQQDEEQSSEFSTPSHTELVTSIDGNIDIVSGTNSNINSSGISGNKIKINISKPLPVIPAKEKDDQ
ncbi:hypothetical protein NQ318_021744 [Aromia moschata]|uniref:Pcf11 C-terminal domain-containing protein n=1 Tax=Aromia moschata TaxID=1265417 RepID=A0AAV8Y1H6_9CUCU|nr:hypothetical protein NQ318_021744 [Aromia moschata]